MNPDESRLWISNSDSFGILELLYFVLLGSYSFKRKYYLIRFNLTLDQCDRNTKHNKGKIPASSGIITGKGRDKAWIPYRYRVGNDNKGRRDPSHALRMTGLRDRNGFPSSRE